MVVAAMRTAEPWCHARCVRECNDLPTDAHEILTRARGGSITDPANILLVCRPCHVWITDHPVEAQAKGLVRWSWEEGLHS